MGSGKILPNWLVLGMEILKVLVLHPRIWELSSNFKEPGLTPGTMQAGTGADSKSGADLRSQERVLNTGLSKCDELALTSPD